MDFFGELRLTEQMKQFTPLLFVALLGSSLVGTAIAGNQAKAVSADKTAPTPAATPATAAAPDPVWLALAIAAYPLDTCVVGGDKLGGDMGPPVNYVFKQAGQPDRLVRFCCPGCIEDFTANPAKFLKMIDDAAAAKAKKN
jgi:hypothetical protein